MAGSTRYRLSADDFDRMIGAGVFDRHDGKVELVNGELVAMNAVYLPHANMADSLFLMLSDVLRGRADLRAHRELSIRVNAMTVRAPDILIRRQQPARRALFRVEDVPHIIEVADTTLGEDLGPKLLDYAAAGVPLYWVVDVRGEVTHVRADPAEGEYRFSDTVKWGQPLSLASLLDATVMIPKGGFD